MAEPLNAIMYPFGHAEVLALTADGAQALSITSSKTIIDGVTVEATGNRTLNLTADSEIRIGAEVVVLTKTNGTETTIFGTGVTGATITGVAGKTFTTSLVYDGTEFKQVGAEKQID